MPAGSPFSRVRRVLHLILPCAFGFAIAAPSQAQDFAMPIAEAAQRFELPEDLIRAVMAAENGRDTGATSRAGAMGLMQIMPATWSDLSRRHGLGMSPYEPRANILAGAAYLREMIDRYGDLRLALAAYNAGPGQVDAYRRGARALPAETIAYIARVTGTHSRSTGERVGAVPPDWRSSVLFTRTSADIKPQGDAALADPAPAAPCPGERSQVEAPPAIFVRPARGPAR